MAAGSPAILIVLPDIEDRRSPVIAGSSILLFIKPVLHAISISIAIEMRNIGCVLC